MLLSVDLRGLAPSVGLVADTSANSVTVRVEGDCDRASAENVLLSVGAGFIPGHYAELSVAWLLARCSSDDRDRAWLRKDRLDETGDWLAAPVEWADDNATTICVAE
jgi:hypothetical protein